MNEPDNKKCWEFEGDWYIQPNEGLPLCVNTGFAAKTLLNLLNNFEETKRTPKKLKKKDKNG